MKKVLLMLAVLVLAVSLASCGGSTAPAADAAPTVAAPAGGAEATAAALNNQLAVANDKIIEFAYGDHIASLDQVRLVRATVSAVATSDAMNQIAREGYKLWIVGHACKFGSRGANNAMGLKRAQQVYNELRAFNVPVTNLKVGTKGDSDLFAGENAAHPKQRRVTFKVAKTI